MIVVDNGSTDDTAAISKAYPTSLYHLSKKGAAAARNFGAKNAKNPWLIFLDSDIVLQKNFLEELRRFLTSTSPSIVALPVITSGNMKEFLHRYRFEARFSQTGGSFISTRDGTDVRPDVNSAAFAVKAKVFKLLGGFDEKFLRAEDSEFSVRAFCHGASIAVCAEAKTFVYYDNGIFSYLHRHFRNGYYQGQLHRLRGGNSKTLFQQMPGINFKSWANRAFHFPVLIAQNSGRFAYLLLGKTPQPWALAPQIEDLVRKSGRFTLGKRVFSLKPSLRILIDSPIAHVFNFESQEWTHQIPSERIAQELLYLNLVEEVYCE